jgi:hypothetical protein
MSGTSLFYAGGGGGGIEVGTPGTGGSSIGGNGGSTSLSGRPGVDGRGSGGGGGTNSTYVGGNGSYGVVIVRYLSNA